VSEAALADAAQLASLADETPEGRSIVVLAKEKCGLRGRQLGAHEAAFVPFSAHTRISGVDLLHSSLVFGRSSLQKGETATVPPGSGAGDTTEHKRVLGSNGRSIRKGAVDAIERLLQQSGNALPTELRNQVDRISREGGTPLAVAENGRAIGVVHLKDIVKGGIRDRFAHLRAMGIKTVMITGDNPLTAAAIAAEAGVDDFMAEATPEDKLKLIRSEQADGRMVAMTGDGTNDAPALAQADVGVAMNTGTMAAKEAGNMVDLDSNPTKLIEIVEIGKQLLMTRGALTTFSIANDVAKYFAIIPAMFILAFPRLGVLNIMGLATPESAILSAVIFNAIIIIALIPLALRGISYTPLGAAAILRRNLLIYGAGGVVLPFAGIKAIDVVLVAVGLA
jgi:K+-transporting ATPase ATPase B chain